VLNQYNPPPPLRKERTRRAGLPCAYVPTIHRKNPYYILYMQDICYMAGGPPFCFPSSLLSLGLIFA
jgi:hypothetical protein